VSRQFAGSANRSFQFHKRRQLFIRTRNETLSEDPMGPGLTIDTAEANLKHSWSSPFLADQQSIGDSSVFGAAAAEQF
jgi:hypothetical protein